jgi:hypothetical protein
MRKILLILLLASCEKDPPACIPPGEITIVSKNIVKWSNKTPVTIEVKGISWPGHTLMTPIDSSEYRIEGHATVRVKTECSEWSEWMEIGY